MTAPSSSSPPYAPVIGPMREGESRYRDLPLLTRCSSCAAPLSVLEVHQYAHRDGRVTKNLCALCCEDLAYSAQEREQ